MNILTLDIGTTSMRGIVFGPAGEILAEMAVTTPLLVDKAHNTIEQRPETYEAGVVEICKSLGKQFRVDAISVTAFRSAPTLVDKRGQALCNFIMWQDTRNVAICNRPQDASAEVFSTCGAPINTVFTATKITWLKENAPALYSCAHKAMVVPDYIIHKMTGVMQTDYTYASRTLLMDIHTLRWSEKMCALFGVDTEKLCKLCPQGAIAGFVQKEFADACGIAQGIPVISAGGDQQCGALGLGVLDKRTLEVNSGTGSFVISLVDRPHVENPAVICNVSAIPGMYTQEMNIIASASAVNWLMQEFFPEYWGASPNFAAINRIAAETPPGANGLFSVAHFQGCGSRNWNPEARAGFWGFTLSSKKNDMVRALYEGIAAEIAKSIDVLPEVCRRAESISIAGGLSKSDIYAEILCDMTGRALTRFENPQATAIGAYVSAAVALGAFPDYQGALAASRANDQRRIFAPCPQNVEFYREYMRRTERFYRASCADKA